MGQRTQLVIEVIKTDHDYQTNKDKKTRYVGSYHNQWGIGKMQLTDVIRFLTSYIDDFSDYELPKKLYKAWLMEDEYVFKGKVTPERVMNWMNTKQDNNNGGILLKVNVNNYSEIESGELYIFNDPEIEVSRYYDEHPEEPYSNDNYRVQRIVSLVDYMSYTPQYFSGEQNEAFVSAFLSLMKFYNIKIMEPVATKPIRLKEKTEI